FNRKKAVQLKMDGTKSAHLAVFISGIAVLPDLNDSWRRTVLLGRLHVEIQASLRALQLSQCVPTAFTQAEGQRSTTITRAVICRTERRHLVSSRILFKGDQVIY